MKSCLKLDTLAFPIELLQRGKDNFTVIYGKQVRVGLNYEDAGKELGLSIMHALACDGRLDNRSKK